MEKSNKKELVEAARLAAANPVANVFWGEVAAELDRLQGARKLKVEPSNSALKKD